MEEKEIKLVRKKKNKKKINYLSILRMIICLIMLLFIIVKISLQKSFYGTYLLIILIILNLPFIYSRIFVKVWLKILNGFMIFIILMMNFMYTNYYGIWYGKNNIKIDENSFYINNQKYSYKVKDFGTVKRIIIEDTSNEIFFHYSLDQNNNEIYLCEFSNNQCVEFYKPKIKNIFYRYVGGINE